MILRKVKNFEYKVSKCGRVWSTKSSKFLKPWERKGYLLVKLSGNGVEKTVSVHRLMLETFIGDCPKGFEALHLNGKSKDNRLENLKWGSPLENSSHKIKHGTLPSKLNLSQIPKIKKLAKEKSQCEVAEMYGVNQSQISRIVNGHTWKRCL